MEGRQDRDGIHEAWLMNRCENADTPEPITKTLVLNSIWTLKMWWLLSRITLIYSVGNTTLL